jgi:hypothetical protein
VITDPVKLRGLDLPDQGDRMQSTPPVSSAGVKILLATHHLADWGGTETYTVTLAKALRARGHQVSVYSPFPGVVSRVIEQEGIPFSTEVGALRGELFAVAHVHHNIVATQVRSALPDVPMVWVCHGVRPEVEQPPTFTPEVTLAVSPPVLSRLRRAGMAAEIVPNMIDTAWFTAKRPIAARPSSALLIANVIVPELRANTAEACRLLGIPLSYVGRPDNPTANVREALERADVVLGVGRTALEAGSMERVVLIYGEHGCTGWLDRAGYAAAFDAGFSSWLSGRHLTPRELADLIADGYSQQRGLEAREVVVEHHGLDVVIPRLEDAYQRAIAHGLLNEPESPRLGLGLDEQFSFYQRELRALRASRAIMDLPAYRLVRWIARALSRSRLYRAARRFDEHVSRIARQ